MSERPPPHQLPLAGLSLPAAMARADFMEAPSNALALRAIEDPAGLPAGKLVLTGPPGAGKTHLATIWAVQRAARWAQPLGLADALRTLLALPGDSALVVDDAHSLAGRPDDEEALFHLHNHLATGGGALLLTADRPVRDWGLRLPDLVSRLTAATHVSLAPPDDALLAAVLVKLFNDRQIAVQPALIDYLLPRMERSLAAARLLVARLDAMALSLKRPVTRQLAQNLLAGDQLAGCQLASDGDANKPGPDDEA